MTTLSKQHIEQLKTDLSEVYGFCLLRCDGYFIRAENVFLKRTLVVGVFVDGYISGKNAGCFREAELNSLNEIQKKFMRCVKKPHGLYVLYPWFNNAEDFIKHIKQQCDDLVILDSIDYYEQLAAKNDAHMEVL